MKVHVKNDLPAAMVDVYDQPITIVREAALACQPIGHERDSTQPHRIMWFDIQQGWYVPLRHDQEVDRCAGVDVLNGQQDVILVYGNPWLSAGDDVAKDAVSHQPTQGMRSSLARGLGVPAAWRFVETSQGFAYLLFGVLVAQLTDDGERLLVMRDSPLGVAHLPIHAAEVA
jgi:hypothetical protein